MNENAQEDNSVDVIKDDTVNSNSQDSFNKDLQKKYEEHKKSETKVPHRPISSYTSNRNFNQANKEIDPVKQIKSKPQSAQATKSNNNSKNSNSKEQKKKNDNDVGIEDILKDLNSFLLSHKIKKSDFIDNPNVFLTFEDFIDVFKQIHYILPKKYLKVLFNYNNPEGAKENYVLMSNFIKNLNFYKIEGIGNESDFSKIENSNLGTSQMNSKHSNQNNTDNKTLTEGLDKKSNKSIYELKYINEQYNQFNKDIIDILKNSKNDNRNNMFNQNYNYNYTFGLNKRPIRGKNLSASKISIESKPKMANYYNEENKSKEREREIIKNILDSNKNENSKISEQKKKYDKYDISQILKNMEKEEEKEANFIRYQFDKRDKQFLKDCVYKCEECNRICSLLGINRNYSVAFDEEMKCRIQEEGKEDFFISLKELVIDWRRLYKQYHQNEILEKYKEKEDVNKNKNVELILNERKKEKEEKHREIKEVLIEAVRLKTKLKSQLDDLKSNIKIDEKIVLEHLRRAGIEIPFNLNSENNLKDNKKK